MPDEAEVPVKDRGKWRDLLAYWMLGLCNNFGYVVMLSAAHDIIGQFSEDSRTLLRFGYLSVEESSRYCHYLSTGAILLADIIPSSLVKLILPFIPFWIKTRVILTILLSACGFLCVAFANSEVLAIVGVALTSASCGIGESSLLAYSPNFNKNVISTWSSGTGGAGIIGSTSYAGLRQIGVSSRDTMLIMLLFPVLQTLSFFVLLRKPEDVPPETREIDVVEEEPLVGCKQKLKYIVGLLKYMIPLALVYFLEYFINQGLFELVYFEDMFLTPAEQYRWYNVDYQVGVFISRSSVNLVQITRIWIMSVFQAVNLVFLLFEAIYFFTPTIWIIFIIIFWEGLLGGAAYVNTYYRMSTEVPSGHRLYAMGIVANSDSFGIVLAGFLAMPVHNVICKMDPVMRTF